MTSTNGCYFLHKQVKLLVRFRLVVSESARREEGLARQTSLIHDRNIKEKTGELAV